MPRTSRRPGAPEADPLRVIRKLLSRAESTDFDSERDACLAKVAELMARHSIEEALVRASHREDRSEPVERIIVVPGPYAARKVNLFGAVGANSGCTVIDLGSDDGAVRRVAVFGFAADVNRMEVLSTSLLVQLTRALLSAGPDGIGPTPGATAAWRRSFITAFAFRVAERLESSRRRRETEVADVSDEDGRAPRPSVSLALADRDRAVASAVRSRYPRLRTQRIDGGSSAAGRAAGRTAGDRATLDDPELRDGPRALRA